MKITIKRYFTNVLIGIDQLINAILKGCPDETLSARAFRNQKQSKVAYLTRVFIDTLFFWQKEHCKHAYINEKLGKQNNKAYRNG